MAVRFSTNLTRNPFSNSQYCHTCFTILSHPIKHRNPQASYNATATPNAPSSAPAPIIAGVAMAAAAPVLVDDESFRPADPDVEAGVDSEVSEPPAGVAAVLEVDEATLFRVTGVVVAM